MLLGSTDLDVIMKNNLSVISWKNKGYQQKLEHKRWQLQVLNMSLSILFLS